MKVEQIKSVKQFGLAFAIKLRRKKSQRVSLTPFWQELAITNPNQEAKQRMASNFQISSLQQQNRTWLSEKVMLALF